MEKYTTTEWRT